MSGAAVVHLTLNEYEAANLAWLLQVASRGHAIDCYADLATLLNAERVNLNTGDWLGQIRWKLEPLVDVNFRTHAPLPGWASARGTLISIDNQSSLRSSPGVRDGG